MHEYTFMQGIVKAILERLETEKDSTSVKAVALKLGILEIHSEAAAQQAFEILTKGTPLEQTQLILEVKPVMVECFECGLVAPYLVDEHTHAHDLLPVVMCPNCDGLASLIGGEGVERITLTFEE